MIVCAIDPGYDRLGIAFLEKKDGIEKIVYSECFETNRKALFEERIYSVGIRVHELIKLYKPNFFAIEDLFFSKNTKTALRVSEVRGVLIYEALRFGLEIFQYTPNQIKLAVTGYGSAKKDDVIFMVKKILTQENLLNKKDDEIDAIALGLTFFATSFRETNKKDL
jgi:crossover junction endodeoxyribonuclease RuvC